MNNQEQENDMDDDDSYPPEWLADAPAPDFDHRAKPRRAGLDARVREFLLMLANGDPAVINRVQNMTRDAVALDQTPELVMALGMACVEQSIACHGRGEQVRAELRGAQPLHRDIATALGQRTATLAVPTRVHDTSCRVEVGHLVELALHRSHRMQVKDRHTVEVHRRSDVPSPSAVAREQPDPVPTSEAVRDQDPLQATDQIERTGIAELAGLA